MPRGKIVVLGAGSFVFGPSVLAQTILEHRLAGWELALVDLDAESLAGMAGVARRMARDAGIDIVVTTHGTAATTLDGAEFVISAIARQMQRRHAMDVAIVERHLPGHLVTEFGGVVGIASSLRQIALIGEVAGEMKHRCPNAWLLNVSNPLPRVCQAAHEAGIRTAGFCSVSALAYNIVWQVLSGGEALAYPWAKAREKYELRIAGTNHCAFLVGLRDRQSGCDLLPGLITRFCGGVTAGNPRCEEFARDTGYLLLPNDDHTRDFLTPEAGRDWGSHTQPWHGTADERRARLAKFKAWADGSAPLDEFLVNPSWERPLDFVAGIALGADVDFDTLNLSNEARQIPQFPPQVFAETGVMIRSGKVMPVQTTLPDSVLPLATRTTTITDLIVSAAREKSLARLREAVELDPTILDKSAGWEAVRECLLAHEDVLPTFS